MTYAEWMAERRDCKSAVCDHIVGTPGCVLDDKNLWRKACIISARKDWDEMRAIANLRMALPPDEFMRECLGWWDEPLGDAPINERSWNEDMYDARSKIVGESFIALDVSPERAWSCIVGVGRTKAGKMHAEITSRNGSFDHRQGTGWVADRLGDMSRRAEGLTVYIASNSAAESLVPDIEQAGVNVVRLLPSEVVAGCGRVYDLAVERELRHIGQDELTSAVTGARQKWIAERAFTWIRSGSLGDITPMYAMTYAVWACDKASDMAANVW